MKNGQGQLIFVSNGYVYTYFNNSINSPNETTLEFVLFPKIPVVTIILKYVITSH